MPEFAPIPRWREISGMGRSKTYEELAAGNLRGVKCGRQLLIDVRHGLEFLRSLPAAQIRPRTAPRRRASDDARPDELAATEHRRKNAQDTLHAEWRAQRQAVTPTAKRKPRPRQTA
jgi:hypothetical protein